jgi:hypothetical protein
MITNKLSHSSIEYCSSHLNLNNLQFTPVQYILHFTDLLKQLEQFNYMYYIHATRVPTLPLVIVASAAASRPHNTVPPLVG